MHSFKCNGISRIFIKRRKREVHIAEKEDESYDQIYATDDYDPEFNESPKAAVNDDIVYGEGGSYLVIKTRFLRKAPIENKWLRISIFHSNSLLKIASIT